jgi:quercetin dioxygenase-like cupin family protein
MENKNESLSDKNSYMELKRNDATLNRPEGDRVLDGTYVFVDIPAFVDQLISEKAWEKNDRNGITVFKSVNLTIVISVLQEGAVLPDNVVDGFLTIQVVKGNVSFGTPDGDVNANEGHMMTFHPGIRHSLKAMSNSCLLITNYSKDNR